MSARVRGYLAAALATAMAVAPALAQDAKVAPPASSASKITQPANKPYLFEQVGDYSEDHPLIVIGISKGVKDQITGEKIGDTLSDVIKKVHGAPSKYFVAPGGDYTAIIFAVKGHLYGPYGLKESLGGLALAADNYDEKVRHGVFPRPDSASSPAPAAATSFAAKPEPQQ